MRQVAVLTVAATLGVLPTTAAPNECPFDVAHSAEATGLRAAFSVASHCACRTEELHPLKTLIVTVAASATPTSVSPDGWQGKVSALDANSYRLSWTRATQSEGHPDTLEFAVRVARQPDEDPEAAIFVTYSSHSGDYGACAIGGIAGRSVH